MTRRQFGLVMAGGAFLVIAQGVYGIVPKSVVSLETRSSTAFGAVSVLRAGRLARLNAQGKPAFRGLDAAASIIEQGGGMPTPLAAAANASGHDHGGSVTVPGVPGSVAPVNETWPDVVVLEVRINNDSPEPVLFSPGQLRLKLGGSGTTVTPQDSNRPHGPIAAGGTENLYVSYLAPRTNTELALEFSDEQRNQQVALALPAMLSGVAL